jgi:hypothetical protein
VSARYIFSQFPGYLAAQVSFAVHRGKKMENLRLGFNGHNEFEPGNGRGGKDEVPFLIRMGHLGHST